LISNVLEWHIIVNKANNWEPEIFTTEIGIAHIKNITHEILLSEAIKKRDVFINKPPTLV